MNGFRRIRASCLVLIAFASLASVAQLAAATETQFVAAADGVRIAYEVNGKGNTALVFVHGWSCDRSYWKGQLESFARDFQVVAIDLGGHGDSGLDRKAWTIPSFGSDVAAVVQKLDLQRVILVGHSMGGDVIVAAARQLKGRVAGLVWVDVYHDLGPPNTPEQIEKFAAPFRANFVDRTRGFVRGMFPAGADPALVERVALDMSAAPPTVALPALESAFGFDREIAPALAALKLPVVAINAGYRPTDAASLKAHGVEVVEMTGVGHFLMMEDPGRFNTILRARAETLSSIATRSKG